MLRNQHFVHVMTLFGIVFGWTTVSMTDEQSGNMSATGNNREEWRSLGLSRVKTPSKNVDCSHKVPITESRHFDWVGESVVFEDKRREDGYERSRPEDSPHAVLVAAVYGQDSHLCTGSLLTPSWVLTAAHCLTVNNSEPSKVVMYAGGTALEEVTSRRPASGSQLQTGQEHHVHPQYDIALVRAARGFRLTDTVNVVRLADQPWGHSGYQLCEYTGYGRVSINTSHQDDMTRKTHRLQVESPCHCQETVARIMKDEDGGHYLCARPEEDHGLCVGDSGGGLVCDGRVWGLALRIVELKDAEACVSESDVTGDITCGGRDTLSVFISTEPLTGWISSYITQQEGGGSDVTTDRGGTARPATAATCCYILPLVCVYCVCDMS